MRRPDPSLAGAAAEAAYAAHRPVPGRSGGGPCGASTRAWRKQRRRRTVRRTDPSLAGKKIWVTRPERQAAQLCRMITALQGVPVRLPTVVIRPAAPGARSPENARLLRAADIVVFISKNAVLQARDLFPRLVAALQGKVILATGRATAQCLQELGLTCAAYAQAGGAESLLQTPPLSRDRTRGARVLIVRGRGGREALRDGLMAHGAAVDYLEVYQREKPNVSRADMEKIWQNERPDAVVVTSLAGLDNLVALTPPPRRAGLYETAVVVMSERIRQHAEATGFGRIAVASGNDDAGLVDALVNLDGND